MNKLSRYTIHIEKLETSGIFIFKNIFGVNWRWFTLDVTMWASLLCNFHISMLTLNDLWGHSRLKQIFSILRGLFLILNTTLATVTYSATFNCIWKIDYRYYCDDYY